MHLFRKVFTEYFVLQSLRKALPSTILNYKACTAYTPVVLCTTRLEENTWRTRATPFCKQPLQFRGTKTNYNKICMTTAPPFRMTTNTLTNSLFAEKKSSIPPKPHLDTTEIAAPKPDPSAKPTNKRFWSTCLKKFKKEKHKRWKLRKSASQPWCRHSNTIYDVQLQKTIVCIVYACSRGNKQLCCSHYNAISRYWNAKHNRTTRNGVRNCSSKTGSWRHRQKKRRFRSTFKTIPKRKITFSAKKEKICSQITIAALMQPLQHDSRVSAAKDIYSITHAAAATSNFDAAITMRYRDIELLNTIELRATAWEIAAPKPDLLINDYRTPMQHACSHYNAISNQGFHNRIELHGD